MIKLTLIQKPIELTDEVERQLVSEFKTNGTSVWKKPYIENALLQMTHGKCAYSEQFVNQKSSYMEIDHFKYKDKYKDEVVRWGNLLPSCKKCNTTKHNHDVVLEPIVNPLVDEPNLQAFCSWIEAVYGSQISRRYASSRQSCWHSSWRVDGHTTACRDANRGR